jgi:hypothetical protein
MATFTSADLPKLVLEIAKFVADAERALPTPQTRLTITTDYANEIVSIVGAVPLASVSGSNGVIALTATDYINDGAAPTVTGTPISSLAPAHPVAALMSAIERLEQAEKVKAASNAGLPTGVGTAWSVAETDLFTFDVSLDAAVSFSVAEGLKFLPTNYVA